MRELKHHEKKLLKKVDFLNWKHEKNIREVKVLRRYHVQNREDYLKYNKLCGQIKKITTALTKTDPKDPYRQQVTDKLLEKLYLMGLVPTRKSLAVCDKVTASCFCRRRLPTVLCRLKMAENMRQAVTYVEQGHIRVGPEVVTDPAFLVTREMEDFVTWVDSSKIKRHVLKYHDKIDDYELLG
eukprot:gnl/Spiro4/22067_TR10855_c0_g1_i1.p1 gnl/Spiro4/22067_TR10855_c0_g1~~gnl/Spiro4/22067_TR10855_c0_g1_i1.p1  ORF type:complete len:183 (-),score=41.01 gnl/Spiro4/22067_TR10855_c0_g1_i1:61-609(-)